MELRTIQNKIYEARGQKIMLDFDLAELYEVGTKVLNQAVKRNIKRFPVDFMFQISLTEWETMRSQIVTASGKTDVQEAKYEPGSQKKRNVSSTPYAFTEQGLAMLSGILNSEKAIEVNIAIMRAFVFIKQYAMTHKDLTEKLKELESKYNTHFKDIHQAISYLLNKDKLEVEQRERMLIGFKD